LVFARRCHRIQARQADRIAKAAGIDMLIPGSLADGHQENCALPELRTMLPLETSCRQEGSAEKAGQAHDFIVWPWSGLLGGAHEVGGQFCIQTCLKLRFCFLDQVDSVSRSVAIADASPGTGTKHSLALFTPTKTDMPQQSCHCQYPKSEFVEDLIHLGRLVRVSFE